MTDISNGARNLIPKNSSFVTESNASIDGVLSTECSAEELLARIERLSKAISSGHKRHQITLKTKLERSRYCRNAHEFEISVTFTRGVTVLGAMSRLRDPCFWRRNIYKKVVRRLEHLAFINKRLGYDRVEKCCSDRTIALAEVKKEQTDTYLKDRNLIIVDTLNSDSPQQINLFEIANSAAESKLNEIFLTVKAFEVIAAQRNFAWALLTLTAPGQFHPNPMLNDEKKSPITPYDPGNDFRSACGYLNNMFKRLQKSLDYKYRRGDDYFGFKVVEVHEDGCPHIHALIFFNRDMKNILEEKLESLYTEDRPAWYFKQFKEKIITHGRETGEDSAKASSYIYNYIAAAIRNEDSDGTDLPKRYKTAIRAASCRQYAFFGIRGSMTKRRMLRKVNRMQSAPKNIKGLANSLHVREDDPNRLEKQLDAAVAFINGEADKVKIETTKRTNRHGETTTNITGVRHEDDDTGIGLTGTCFPIYKFESKFLQSDSKTKISIAVKDITERLKGIRTINTNYSSKSVI